MTKINTETAIRRIAALEREVAALKRLLKTTDEKSFIDGVHEGQWKQREKLYRDERVF